MQHALTKNEIPKIFIGGQKDAIDSQAPIQHRLIVDPGIVLCNEHKIVPHSLHAWTYSIGYTNLAPRTTAAKAIAERMPSSVRRVCAARI